MATTSKTTGNALRFCALILCAGFIAACEEDRNEASTAVVKSVKVKEMKVDGGIFERTISGIVTASNQSNLSFRVSGRITEIAVKSGESVEEGQPLAKLEQQDFVLALNNAEAGVGSAKAGLAEQEANLARQQYLKERDHVSQAAVDKAQTAYESAVSQLEVAQSNYEIAGRNLESTTLRAPFDGSILDRLADPFAEIGAGQTVFQLQGNEGLEVEVLMPETLVRSIAHGDEVGVSFPTLKDLKTDGTVAEIGSRVESGNAFPVSVRLADRAKDGETGILPGMTAQVHFSLGDKHASGDDVYTIPVSAIDMRVAADESDKVREGEVRIFLYDPVTGSARHRVVRVRDVHGNEVVVREGLKEGDMVVTAGVPFLTDGQAVQPWKPDHARPARLNPPQNGSTGSAN